MGKYNILWRKYIMHKKNWLMDIKESFYIHMYKEQDKVTQEQ
jgi:hypothetical protein